MIEERLFDEEEVTALAARWGRPARQQAMVRGGDDFWRAWGQRWPGAHREVMFLLPRPGGLLLHRKAHYPPLGWRLPTGGIGPGEGVTAALRREIAEEVGLTLPIRRYVALLCYELELEGERRRCATHLFLMGYSDAPLQPSHDGEIAATRTVALSELEGVAARLEGLPPPWQTWGRFRAIAHRVAHSLIQPGELAPG